jgi:hypothetical protein
LAKLFGYDDGTGNNKDFEAPEGLPPGFEAAVNSASETGLANGQGFENGQGLGVGNIPLGQLKKLSYAEFGTYSPDDYFEDATEDLREDSFEEKFDKMNKNSKAKEKKDKEKQNADRLLKEKGNTGGGNPNCDDEGIVDGDSTNITGTVGVEYTVQGFTAIGSNCKDATAQIRITVDGPSSPPSIITSELQSSGVSFTPTVSGEYIIEAKAVGQFEPRTVTVSDPPTQVTGLTGNAVSQSEIDISWNANPTEENVTGYKIERQRVGGPSPPWIEIEANNLDTDYSDSGLETNQNYRYRVSAINAEGTGPASAQVQIKTNN